MRVLTDILLRQAGQQLPCFSPRVLVRISYPHTRVVT